jgi:hypothetical protein
MACEKIHRTDDAGTAPSVVRSRVDCRHWPRPQVTYAVREIRNTLSPEFATGKARAPGRSARLDNRRARPGD